MNSENTLQALVGEVAALQAICAALISTHPAAMSIGPLVRRNAEFIVANGLATLRDDRALEAFRALTDRIVTLSQGARTD